MPRIHRPRKGTLQYWPRKRARRIYPKIRSWASLNDQKLLGFAGYKAGMTHIIAIDNSKSTTKNLPISIPVTIIECPPLKSFSLRFYKNTDHGLKIISEVFAKNLDKELLRKIKLSKKQHSYPENFDKITLVVYTQPKLTTIGKKKPEIFELALGNNNLDYAKQLLEKEIKITDVFKEGQLVDVHSVTKGYGYQGTIKRYGLKIKQHKSEKHKRAAGNLGPWTPSHVKFSVPQPGQLGLHTRTEYNKWMIKISNDLAEINQAGGILSYGLIKNDYILLKGSVPGAVKRLIRLSEPLRPNSKTPTQVPQIKKISISSKQGT